jgi:hypothetical protein
MPDTTLFIPELKDRFVDYRKDIWGDSFSWSWARKSTEIKYLVIHHSVTIHEATADDIALLHKARGWGGIGYHFVITKDGKVWYVGDVSTARANVANMNEKVIGICMVGDFTKHLPSDQQIESAHLLCKFFIEQAAWPNVKCWDDVVGHKELDATACPGDSWDKKQEGDMWWRIKTGTIYTEQDQVENVEQATNDAAITTYEKLIGDLNEILKLPGGNDSFVKILTRATELATIETNYKPLKEKHDILLADLGKMLNLSEINETAVLGAVKALILGDLKGSLSKWEYIVVLIKEILNKEIKNEG